ncbi:CoA transferase [Parafrigoribacterium mesophilum]|uniref:CoA transferase n=1 Tax=Parafrigoribacterium mesophilum TaxID=433646 RepID=UPI0031FBD515
MSTPWQLVAAYDRAMGTRSSPGWIELDEPNGYLAASLPVAALAQGSVAALAASVNRFLTRSGGTGRTWRMSMERVAASFAGDRMMRVDGQPVTGFAELSGFFQAADGWVRTHANYPHHRLRLLKALGLAEDSDRAVVAERIAGLSARDVENRSATADAIAVRVRDETEWSGGAPGRALARQPLVARHFAATAAATPRNRVLDPELPLAGIRVLDFTRVIAGPVATRVLGLLGADVLRLDPPQLPELVVQHMETGQGKRSALLDLSTAAGRSLANDLLSTADILVTGYRPGALERYGLEHPAGLVHALVSAWGTGGPWAHRRGFDSIVQAASGIAIIQGGRERPGALPAQALDHASGYLLAAAAVDALTETDSDGRARDVSVSLAGTARWLLQAARDLPTVPLRQPSENTTVVHGAYRTARPPLQEYDDYRWPAREWGSDKAQWHG